MLGLRISTNDEMSMIGHIRTIIIEENLIKVNTFIIVLFMGMAFTDGPTTSNLVSNRVW